MRIKKNNKIIKARKQISFKREIAQKYDGLEELMKKFISDTEWSIALSVPNSVHAQDILTPTSCKKCGDWLYENYNCNSVFNNCCNDCIDWENVL